MRDSNLTQIKPFSINNGLETAKFDSIPYYINRAARPFHEDLQMKLFYSDKFSEPQGGSPYSAMLAFLVLYCVCTLGIGFWIGGTAGHEIYSDWWVGTFLGILPTSGRYKIRIGRLRALLLVIFAVAALYYAKGLIELLIPFAPTEQLGTIEILVALGAEIFIGLICVNLVGQYLWKGFKVNLF
ncbi:Conserved hypothetical membrane protein (plasmid) [Pseudomonas veronii 1YdBTEX2]|nr:Conserved hypothetical membrane protein [Pseudomonas veronii 1YdBTEX2]